VPDRLVQAVPAVAAVAADKSVFFRGQPINLPLKRHDGRTTAGARLIL
jgi:hypothetical protein